MDYLPELDLREVPLRVLDANTTPGSHLVFVVDCETGKILNDVCKIDLDAGLIWETLVSGGRAHPRKGVFKVVATADVIEEYKERWKS